MIGYFYSNSKNILLLLFLLMFSFNYSQEICNNAIDDDGDGFIDLNDSADCICGLGTPSIVTSIIPNPSFELMNYCPSTYSQMNAVTSWLQATDATSDYMNICDFVMPAIIGSGGLPFPDGNGIAGTIFLQDYKEYIGACLLTPMTAGIPYRITFHLASTPISNDGHPCGSGITYDPVDISIFGSSSCSALPVSGYTNCPSITSSAWNILGATTYTPSQAWGIITITFTPSTTINSIILGPPCSLPGSYNTIASAVCNPYFYYDNMVLNELSQFGSIDLTPTGHYCSNNIIITANATPTVTTGAILQWYHDGVAIPGATSYTYSVASGAPGLGDYQVGLTDGFFCALSPIYKVTSTAPHISLNTPITTCPGNNSILTAISLCTTYTWSTGATTSSISVSPLTTSTYTVTGSLGSCTSQATGSVTTFNMPTVTGNTLICSGQSTTLTANGGDNYYWLQDGFTINDVFSGTVVATPQASCTYTVNVGISMPVTSSYCVVQVPFTVSVSTTPTVTIKLGYYYQLCLGDSIILEAISSGPPTYTWSTGSYSASILVNPTISTTYTVFSSIDQCVGYDTILVQVINPSVKVNSPTICYGQTATLTATDAAAYSWSNDVYTATQIVSPTSSTTYTVVGGIQCLSIAFSTVTVLHPVADFSGVNNGDALLQGSNLSFINKSSDATSYLWTLCDGSTSITDNTLAQTFLLGNCCIKLTAYNDGCMDSIIKCYKIVPEITINIPNVISPNGDGINDIFKFNSKGITKLTCQIFNRWGLKLYEWSDPNGGWEGFTTSGTEAPTGTYFFILTYIDITDQPKTEKGFLTLFRD